MPIAILLGKGILILSHIYRRLVGPAAATGRTVGGSSLLGCLLLCRLLLLLLGTAALLGSGLCLGFILVLVLVLIFGLGLISLGLLLCGLLVGICAVSLIR